MKYLTERYVKGCRRTVKAAKLFFDRLESNICKEINSFGAVTIFVWTVICLSYINIINSFSYVYAVGALYYISFIIICLIGFKGIRTYLQSPFKLNNIPEFIGKKLDVVFSYPIFLLSLISILNKIMEITGLVPRNFQQLPQAEGAGFMLARLIMLPIAALSEELLNLIAVSFIYKHLKVLKQLRLLISIIAASALFGLLHSFAWGGQAVLPLAVAFVPSFILTLYTGNIWISTLAHLYNNIAASAGMLGKGYSHNVLVLLVIVPAAWAIVSIIKACIKK